jgi:hypothetical protein
MGEVELREETQRCESCGRQKSEHVWLDRRVLACPPFFNTAFVPAGQMFSGPRLDVT